MEVNSSISKVFPFFFNCDYVIFNPRTIHNLLQSSDVHYEIISLGILGRLITKCEDFALPLHLQPSGGVFQFYCYSQSLKPDIQIHILVLKRLELQTSFGVRHRFMNVPRKGELKIRLRVEHLAAFGKTPKKFEKSARVMSLPRRRRCFPSF